MSTTTCMEEALASTNLVPSLLDTLRMGGWPLATTSAYSKMVTSMWGRDTGKMEMNGQEALSTLQMVLKRSLTLLIEIVINYKK
jgi:hypothetical protein